MTKPVPSLRLRFLAGVALGAACGVWLAHGFTGDARRQAAAETEERKAVVGLQAVTSLVRRAGGEGDAARMVVAAWQAGTTGASSVRVAKGMELEVSTAPADVASQAAPRRLQREEKPLYDRGQRVASAVQTNREEQGSRKEELEAAVLDSPGGRRLSLAGPLEIGGAPAGTVEVVTAPLPPAPETGWLTYLLALVLAVGGFGVLALVIGEKQLPLAGAAVVCLGLSLLFVLHGSTQQLEVELRLGAAAVSERVQQQVALVESLAVGHGLTAPAPGPASDWDADAARRPRGQLTREGAVDAARLDAAVASSLFHLRRALLTADALALVLLLLSGFGALNALGSALSRHRQAYLYIAPAIIGMLVLVFFPFSYGITLSFTDQNLYNTNKPITEIWVGLQNYAAILGDFQVTKPSATGFVINYANFYWTLLFTIFWTVTNVTLGVSSGLFLALILNTRALAFRPIYRVLLILPWAMPNYITALIWKGMFHQQFGVINQVLQMFGLHAVNWFDKPGTSFLTALATNAWLSFPFMMVVSLGALQSIPADLYEAATVDGASRWQAFKAITLPSLKPALVPAVILSVVWTFNMFNIIFLVTAGEPGGATEILVTQAYKFAFQRYRYGYAAAYSTVIFGILLVYGTLQNRWSKATES